MIRIAFFFTMPISRKTPIRAMIEKSMPEQHQRDAPRRRRPTAASRAPSSDARDFHRARPARCRSRRSRRRSASGCCACDCWKVRAVPWKLPRTLVGMPMSASAALITAAARRRACAPSARLNEIVVASSPSWWLIEVGAPSSARSGRSPTSGTMRVGVALTGCPVAGRARRDWVAGAGVLAVALGRRARCGRACRRAGT